MDKNDPTLAYYVYLLRCSDGSYYVGHTNDLEHRLAAQERGATQGYSLSRRPVELVFSDQFSRRLGSLPSGKVDYGMVQGQEGGLDKGRLGWGGWNYPTGVVGQAPFDRLRMRSRGLGMRGKRLRMKVLVDEDRLED